MKAKLNIAIVIPGGIGTGKNNIGIPVLERIVERLAKEFSVTVFQLYKTNQDYKANGFELIDISSNNSILRSLKFIWVFRGIHYQRKFNVVHAFWGLPTGLLAVLVGKIFGIKSMISLQGGDAIALPEIEYGQLRKWIPRKLSLWAMRETDELISPTRFMIDNLRSYGLVRSEVKYIPLGVDPSVFVFLEKKIDGPVKFLHIGNFNRVKDQQTLLKAFQIISKMISCELTIIGEGELEDEIKLCAHRLGLDDKVKFQGTVPYESLPEYFHRSDVLLHTSLSEGHPIVVEEAMSCGVLVCGTKVGLLYDLPDCCVSVGIRDFDSLATATLQVIHDLQQMSKLKKCASQWASKHSITWTVGQIKKLYDAQQHA